MDYRLRGSWARRLQRTEIPIRRGLRVVLVGPDSYRSARKKTLADVAALLAEDQANTAAGGICDLKLRIPVGTDEGDVTCIRVRVPEGMQLNLSGVSTLVGAHKRGRVVYVLYRNVGRGVEVEGATLVQRDSVPVPTEWIKDAQLDELPRSFKPEFITKTLKTTKTKKTTKTVRLKTLSTRDKWQEDDDGFKAKAKRNDRPDTPQDAVHSTADKFDDAYKARDREVAYKLAAQMGIKNPRRRIKANDQGVYDYEPPRKIKGRGMLALPEYYYWTLTCDLPALNDRKRPNTAFGLPPASLAVYRLRLLRDAGIITPPKRRLPKHKLDAHDSAILALMDDYAEVKYLHERSGSPLIMVPSFLSAWSGGRFTSNEILGAIRRFVGLGILTCEGQDATGRFNTYLRR